MGGKILCLHGYTQSGSHFARKTSGIRKFLGKLDYETVYPTAPIACKVPDVVGESSNVDSTPASTPGLSTPISGDTTPDQQLSSSKSSYTNLLQSAGGDENFSWWGEVHADRYDRLDESWDLLKDVLEKEGPFDGILGFSQGAIMGSMLIKAAKTLVPQHPPFKFAMFFSGYRSPVAEYQKYYQPPIDIPTLHVIGTLDTVVPEEKSMTLVESTNPNNRVVVRHPGGHYVPNNKPMQNAVKSFIQGAIDANNNNNNTTATQQKPKKSASEISDDWEDLGAKIGAV